MRVQDDPNTRDTATTEGFAMEREDIHRQRTSVTPQRSTTAGESPRRLLDNYPGTLHHGGSRRDPRDRPHATDLIETEERT